MTNEIIFNNWIKSIKKNILSQLYSMYFPILLHIRIYRMYYCRLYKRAGLFGAGSSCNELSGRCSSYSALGRAGRNVPHRRHRSVNWAMRHIPPIRKVAVWGDDRLGYGKTNSKLKWWLDLEDTDGSGYHIPKNKNLKI